MQSNRLLQYLILFFLFSQAFAQPNYWFRLYADNNISEITKLLKDDKIHNLEWKTFFKNIFAEEIDVAIPTFVQLYDKTQDRLLKKVILDRISQYYYSKGLYDTADRIIRDAQFRNQIFSLKRRSIQFGVQLGAFSTMQNALRGKEIFSNKLRDISIITKNKNGKKLYLVVAGKYSLKTEAENLKRKIFNDFRHKGMIIQY